MYRGPNKIINRTGLESLLRSNERIVEILDIDMETGTGKFKRGFDKFSSDELVTVWFSFEESVEIEEALERGERVEVIGEPFRQPNGRAYLRARSILGEI